MEVFIQASIAANPRSSHWSATSSSELSAPSEIMISMSPYPSLQSPRQYHHGKGQPPIRQLPGSKAQLRSRELIPPGSDAVTKSSRWQANAPSPDRCHPKAGEKGKVIWAFKEMHFL